MPEIDDIKVTEKWLSAKSQKLLLKCSNFPSSQKKKGKKKKRKKGKTQRQAIILVRHYFLLD